MRNRLEIWSVGLAGLLNVLPAHAAIRVCNDIVSSEVTVAADELSAKKQSIEQWRAKAAKTGEGMDVWRLAASKSLKCFKRDDGLHECVAFGAPCIIQQNPNQRPVGKDRKGQDL